jgi:hypothetical protein
MDAARGKSCALIIQRANNGTIRLTIDQFIQSRQSRNGNDFAIFHSFIFKEVQDKSILENRPAKLFR